MSTTVAWAKRGAKIYSLLMAIQSLTALQSQAADLAYRLDLGAGYTDNIALTSTGKRDETIATAGLQVSLSQLSRRIDANLVGDLAYYDYLRNTYSSEVVGSFTGGARLAIVPERFVWIFQDNFGQGVRDIFAAVSPNNRENINYFTTGPEFTSRLGGELWARLSAQYSKVSYEVSPFDSDRYSGSLGVFRDLSSASTVSANVRASRVEYDSNLGGANFNQDEAFLQYFTHGGRTTATLDLGYTELKQADTKSKGLLTRLNVTRQISAATKLSLNLGREFSNQGSAFQFQQGLGGVNLQTQSVTQTTDPFTSKYADVGLDFQRGRTGLGASIGYFDESYSRQTLFDRSRINLICHRTRLVAFDFIRKF